MFGCVTLCILHNEFSEKINDVNSEGENKILKQKKLQSLLL